MSKVEKGLFQGIPQAAHEVGGQMSSRVVIFSPCLGVSFFKRLKVGDFFGSLRSSSLCEQLRRVF